MRIQCDVCERNLAAVMCCADEAALCSQCDMRVHAANKLASKHQRVPLLHSIGEPPTCDICQEKSAFFFCLEDRALLCRDCDVSIHLPNSLSATHKRFLLTGTRVALEALTSSPSDSGNDEVQAVPGRAAVAATDIPSTSDADLGLIALKSSLQPQQQNSGSGLGMPPGTTSGAVRGASLASLPVGQAATWPGGAGGTGAAALGRKSSYPDLMSDAMPGWRVDELLNIPELADGYTLADIGSSKAEAANLGDFDWTADLSLFDEQVYAESLHEVPSLPSPGAIASGSRNMQSALKGRARHDLAAVVPDYDDAFVVPDLGLDTSPPVPKRRRNSHL